MSDIVSRLRDAERYGQFGHSLLYGQVADEIEQLCSEIERLRSLINEWVDVQPGRTKTDMDRRISIAYDLRKAVGR
jgi:hypothetical protein